MQVYAPPQKQVPSSPTDPFFRWKKVGKVFVTDKALSPKSAPLLVASTGLWLPGKWAGPCLDLGGKAHVVFYIDPAEEGAALETLRAHNVKFWGPRYNEKRELHIDFEDPDGHFLEIHTRPYF